MKKNQFFSVKNRIRLLDFWGSTQCYFLRSYFRARRRHFDVKLGLFLWGNGGGSRRGTEKEIKPSLEPIIYWRETERRAVAAASNWLYHALTLGDSAITSTGPDELQGYAQGALALRTKAHTVLVHVPHYFSLNPPNATQNESLNYMLSKGGNCHFVKRVGVVVTPSPTPMPDIQTEPQKIGESSKAASRRRRRRSATFQGSHQLGHNSRSFISS